MNGLVRRHMKSGGATLAAVALALVAFQTSGSSQGVGGNLMYNIGQAVVPLYHGWEKFPDGTTDIHYGYLNRNWQEEIDIPVGPDNNVNAPYGPDAGQPTHFLPRANRWQFKVRVPADFETKKGEVVWTLTSKGETLRAYSNLHPAFVQDEFGRQREFYGTPPETGNAAPVVNLEVARQLTARVGEPVTLTAIATDDGVPAPRFGGTQGVGAQDGTRRRRVATSGSVGGSMGRGPANGLRFNWYVYRGAGRVRFNPESYKTWEDNRAGANSPWSPGWLPPPVPEGNRWVYQATFSQPGTYVLRGLGHDGLLFDYEDVTITVTP